MADAVSLDIPLFIRLMEFAREDAKGDVDLHVVAERAVKLGSKTLSMADYEKLINNIKEETKMAYEDFDLEIGDVLEIDEEGVFEVTAIDEDAVEMVNEEGELFEISKKTLASYIPKAASSLHNMGANKERMERATDAYREGKNSASHYGGARTTSGFGGDDIEKQLRKRSDRLQDKTAIRYDGIRQATKRLAKEDVELPPNVIVHYNWLNEAGDQPKGNGTWLFAVEMTPGQFDETNAVIFEGDYGDAYDAAIDWLLEHDVEHLYLQSLSTVRALDEISRKTLTNYVNRVAASHDGADRTRGLKLAAKKLTKRKLREDEEQLDELSRKTLANYVKKAAYDSRGGKSLAHLMIRRANQQSASDEVDRFTNRNDISGDKYKFRDEMKKKLGADTKTQQDTSHGISKRVIGIDRATRRLKENETVEIDEELFDVIAITEDSILVGDGEDIFEISKALAGRYAGRAVDDAIETNSKAIVWGNSTDPKKQALASDEGPLQRRYDNRMRGLKRAGKKLGVKIHVKDDVDADGEQLDELSKEKLQAYIDAAHSQATTSRNYAYKKDWSEKNVRSPKKRQWHIDRMNKRAGGMTKAIMKMEDVINNKEQ